jgi:hypothetical protein
MPKLFCLYESCIPAPLQNEIDDSVIYNAAYKFCEDLGFRLDLNAPSHRTALMKFTDEIKKA